MKFPQDVDKSSTFSKGRIAGFKIIDDELNQVRELIEKQFSDKDDFVERLLGTFNICSGKMLRSGLVLLAGGSCGKITEEHIRVAAIFEMIHNATLLHDDVIDHGQKRRGVPTVNTLWGNESAVLFGDFILSMVFKMTADLSSSVIKVIASAVSATCRGEIKQINQKQNWLLTESDYIDIISEKSAALFSTACYLGGFLAGAEKGQNQALADFGLNTGIAFQITDDLVDIIGDEGKAGKTLGSDVARNKPTVAVIHLLSRLDDKQRANLIEKFSTDNDSKQILKDMVKSNGSLRYTQRLVEEYIARAIKSLSPLKEGEAKTALIETANYVAKRFF